MTKTEYQRHRRAKIKEIGYISATFEVHTEDLLEIKKKIIEMRKRRKSIQQTEEK
jgi:hypothetical protein